MINRGNIKIGCEHKHCNLYPLMAINEDRLVYIAESSDSNLWHGRLGHMSQVRMDGIMAIGYIPKLQTKTDFYGHCCYGKQSRSPHSLHYEMVPHSLVLVHTDICGMMPERSRKGTQYFIKFGDYCRRKV